MKVDETQRYTPALNGTAFMGMTKCIKGGEWVLYSEAKALEEEIATLESAMNIFGEDPSWCELLIEKCAEITKLDEQIAALEKYNKKLLDENMAYQNENAAQRRQIAELRKGRTP